MKNLLIKELKLASHVTNWLFLALSAMLLIPEYPYLVAFFYTTLGIFFVCLTGRENNDVIYSATLPIRKRDIVKARYLLIVFLEVLQIIVAIPFTIIRQNTTDIHSSVGMEANIALLAFGFVLFGLFNIVFLTGYYRNPNKLGKPFLFASTLVFVYIGVIEALTHVVPFFRDKLDTFDNMFVVEKLLTLAVAIIIYAALTFISYRKSAKTFEALDL